MSFKDPERNIDRLPGPPDSGGIGNFQGPVDEKRNEEIEKEKKEHQDDSTKRFD